MRAAQLQERMFTPNLRRLDPIPAADAGDAEQVKLAAGKVSPGKVGLDAGLLDEREIREMLDGDDIIGNLEIDAPWLEPPGGRAEREAREAEAFDGGMGR